MLRGRGWPPWFAACKSAVLVWHSFNASSSVINVTQCPLRHDVGIAIAVRALRMVLAKLAADLGRSFKATRIIARRGPTKVSEIAQFRFAQSCNFIASCSAKCNLARNAFDVAVMFLTRAIYYSTICRDSNTSLDTTSRGVFTTFGPCNALCRNGVVMSPRMASQLARSNDVNLFIL